VPRESGNLKLAGQPAVSQFGYRTNSPRHEETEEETQAKGAEQSSDDRDGTMRHATGLPKWQPENLRVKWLDDGACKLLHERSGEFRSRNSSNRPEGLQRHSLREKVIA
jgi:hypothetical protein